MKYCDNCKGEMKKVESTQGPLGMLEFGVKYKCRKCGYTKKIPIDICD